MPRKTVSELNKILEKDGDTNITIHLSENYFHLKTNDTTVLSHLIDGNFPNYAQVIPSNHKNTAIINRMDFLDNLQQVSILVEEHTKGVKLLFKDSELHIFSHSERGQAKAKVAVKNFNKETSIAFNIHYLISILKVLTTDEVNMVLPSENSQSCLLSSIGDKSYQYVVMPMKI